MDGLANTITRIDKEMNGNGQPGVRQDVNEIRQMLAAMRATEAERERAQKARHAENAEKLNGVSTQIGKKTLIWTVAGVSVAMAALAIMILSIYFTVRISHISDLHQLIGDHAQSQRYLTQNHQDAISTHP